MFRTALLALLLLPLAVHAASDPFDLNVDIPFSIFKLDNGLTLIVHEDHKAPIVAINLWYHVGSKNEQRGKTGFAHLFEHLMFNGSEHNDEDYFKAMEKVGATTLNGTTNRDRTNYFQNVPTSALDLVLWMESDRMGHLLGAVTQEKLDEQRGVVQNEKRQGENRPYGKGSQIQYSSIYPYNHPYSWTTIGSMDDLNAATLEDIHAWFKKHYGAANTVIVIAGDIDTEEAKKKVEHYFGDIEAGPPPTRQTSWVAKLTGTHKEISYDRVPQTMLMKSWNVPGNSTIDVNHLDLVGSILARGKTSRLYKRLVYDEQLVSRVAAYTSTGEIAGTFEITAYVNQGVSEARVDAIIDEELNEFLANGPTKKELERVKIQTISGFVRGIETIGGFGGKSDILASNYIYTGDPGFYKQELKWISEATSEQLRDTARKWLSDGLYQLEIRPFAGGTTTPSTVDRSSLPEPGTTPTAKFPAFERAELANGLKIIVARRDAIPVVQFQLSLDAGNASDQFTRPGLASLAMNMLDEGTTNRNALEISEDLSMLGASVSAGSNLDTSFVSLSALKTTLDGSVDLFADIVLNPSFPEKELPRLRTQQLTAIQREQSNPQSMALRVFPKLIYGEGHAYSNPFSGAGTLQSVREITLEEIKQFHATWFKPNHATMIVVGDTSLEEILPVIEARFNQWEPGEIPAKNISRVAKPDATSLYLIDRPGSQQSILLAGLIATPKANPDEIATEAMNNIIGGAFTSRINSNLREDKHWSYGARSGLLNARGQRAFYVLTSVQTDKTAESIQEVLKELRGYVSDQPTTEEELFKTVQRRTLSLSGRWETARSVLGDISQIVQYGLPDDYFTNYPAEVSRLKSTDIDQIARKLIYPESLVWIVVGDRAVIEPRLQELGLGRIHHIDTDGNMLSDSG